MEFLHRSATLPAVAEFRLFSPAMLFSVVLLWLSSLVVYRLFLHPLSGFPGPKLAAATKWYECYFDLLKGSGGEFIWEVERLHRLYGPIVRITPDELHIQDPDWFDSLYAAGGAVRDKYHPAAKMVGTPLAGFGTVSHHQHRRRRLPLASYFSKKAVSESGPPVITKGVEILCERLEVASASREPVNLRVIMLAFTTDNYLDFALGSRGGYLDNPQQAAEYFETAKAVGEVSRILKQFTWIVDVALRLPLTLVQMMHQPLARLTEIHAGTQSQAREFVKRKSRPVSNSDTLKATAFTSPHAGLFEAIWDSNAPPEEKTADRLAQELFVTLTAGGETSARTLARAMYFIAVTPGVLERLQGELRTVMPDRQDVPSLKALEDLPYLRACVKEALRTAGQIGSRLPLVSPTEALGYKQWTIPAGTAVSMTIYSTLYDRERYPNPDKFEPERWLGEGQASTEMERSFVAFSRGSRACLGIHFAYAQLYLSMAVLLRRFAFEPTGVVYERDIKIVRECVLAEASRESPGVIMQVRARET